MTGREARNLAVDYRNRKLEGGDGPCTSIEWGKLGYAWDLVSGGEKN